MTDIKRGKVRVGGVWLDICPPDSGGASGGGLPVTGQTTSYRPGDDGDIQAGISNDGRFVDNGDGTITDNATQLMWRKWSYGRNQSTGSGSNATLTWYQALDLQGDSHAGYSDWRLPNVLELMTLVNFDASSGAPYTYKDVFPNTESNYYWTSTTNPDNTSIVPCVFFIDGRVVGVAKTFSRWVRLVRSL